MHLAAFQVTACLSVRLCGPSFVQLVSRLNHLGGTLDPHACFLLQRGLKTLPLRVRQQSTNALALAHFLENQPQVLQPAVHSASCTKDSEGWQVASVHTRRHDASGHDDCIQDG